MSSSEYLTQFLRKRKSDTILDVTQSGTETKLKDMKLKEASLEMKTVQDDIVRVLPVVKGDTFLHEVALPPGVSCPVLKPIDEPILTFPFQLDDFQQRAVLCIHNGYSVLVSAHTSAGKTVVAEYAIAKALRDKQRVIYTTPIKALSNQKYREFATNGKFTDVGLLTGDVSINPNASLVIMTTEILRLMLYRNHDLVREMGWAIFDEVHYLRDSVRGVVWEECLSLLPSKVRNVFLSATIPNASEFAQWIVHLQCSLTPESKEATDKEKITHPPLPCHVIYTERRPVPLQHFLCVSGTRDMRLVLNDKGEFFEEELQRAVKQMSDMGDTAMSDDKKLGRHGGTQCHETAITKAIDAVFQSNLSPVIVFSFNKRHTEVFAKSLMNANLENKLVTREERDQIMEICRNAMTTLSESDRQLKQVKLVSEWMSHGIGVHHGGLIPIVKELVELVFGEGLLKVLFATETFAMGLNMPARTVIFSSLTKYDGQRMRCLTPSEYIQMSGRAGRRGKDERGTVILLVSNDLPRAFHPPLTDSGSTEVLRHLLIDKPEPLYSTFHLTNNMLLQLMRVEQLNPEYIMKRSLLQFQSISQIPSLAEEAGSIQDQMDRVSPQFVGFDILAQNYSELTTAIDFVNRDMWRKIFQKHNMSSFLTAGRVVKIADYGWCILVESSCRFVRGQGTQATLYCLVPLRNETTDTDSSSKLLQKPPPSKKSKSSQPKNSKASLKPSAEEENLSAAPTWKMMKFQVKDLRSVSKAKLLLEDRTRDNLEQSTALCQSIQPSWEKLLAAYLQNLPELHPLHDLKLSGKELEELFRKKVQLEERLVKLKTQLSEQICSTGVGNCTEIIERWERQQVLFKRHGEIQKQMEHCRSLLQLEELRSRQNLLRTLGYCSEDGVLHLKGLVACEITSSDELILTELLFDNFFHSITIPELCAVLTCFLAEEKLPQSSDFKGKNSKNKKKDAIPEKGSEAEVTKRLHELAATIHNKIRHLAKVIFTCGVCSSLLTAEELAKAMISQYHAGFMLVAYEWARGKTFTHVSTINPKIFPGSIIRVMRRLGELLQQMHTASKVMGNDELALKFSSAINFIKRDVVFTASLYL